MTTRINQQPENSFIAQVKELDDTIRELKTGVQYVEANMIEYSSGNSYDMTGTWPTTTVGNQILFRLIITATSSDGAPFLAQFFPQLWFNSFSGNSYNDTNTSTFGITFNNIITDDPKVIKFWVQVYARPSGTAAGTFWMKAHIYASAPVTVTYTRDA